MNPDIKKQWVDALKSGEYRQGEGALNNEYRGDFCCLGVLCDLAEKAGIVKGEVQGALRSFDGALAYLPRVVVEWAGLEGENPVAGNTALSALNDRGDSFKKIAKKIDEHL